MTTPTRLTEDVLDVVLKAAEEAGVLGPLQAHLAALEQEAARLRHELGKWGNAVHHARLGAETLLAGMDDGQPVTVVVLAEWRLATLRQDVEDAESRGYERAREQAAETFDGYAREAEAARVPLAAQKMRQYAATIRAMTDERARGGMEPKTQMVADLRGAADALERWHVSGSPFISRRDNTWVFEAYFRLRNIADRIADNYGEGPSKQG